MLDRTIACHVAAASFSLFVLAPTILICWDRSLPFEQIEGGVSFSQQTAFPGDEVELRFVTGPVRSSIGGEFERMFFDGEGRAIALGTHDTVYNQTLEPGAKTGVFYKRFRIPRNAKAGEALYVSRSKFWHNEAQHYVWPIVAPKQTAKIRVLAQPIDPVPGSDAEDVRRPR